MPKQIPLQEYIQSPFSSHYVNKLIGVRLKHTIYSILITFAVLLVLGGILNFGFDAGSPMMALCILFAFPAFYFSHLWVESFAKDLPYAISLGDDTLVTLTAGSLTFENLTQCHFSSPHARQLHRVISQKGRGFFGFEVDLLNAIEQRHHRGDPAITKNPLLA